MKKILWIVLYIWASGIVWGQNKLSLCTKKFLSEYSKIELEKGKIDEQKFFKQYGVFDLKKEKYVSAFICLKTGAERSVLTREGVRIGSVASEIITAEIPIGNLKRVSELEAVKYIQIATPVYLMMDSARAVSGVEEVHSGIGLASPFKGKGVVIGIIDLGFEYGHPNFYSEDKEEYRVKLVWDQNKEGAPPAGYEYGTELTTQEEILNARNDNTYATHGTHVAGIAAGADTLEGNTYYGIAGEADLVLVSIGEDVERNTVKLSDAISYIYRYAESVGKPCVINMSLGTQLGPHDGTSMFDRLTTALQGKGKLLVGAGGNSGKVAFHILEEFRSDRDEALKTFIKFLNQPSESFHGTSVIDIWGEGGMHYKIQACIYDKKNNEIVATSSELDASSVKGNEETWTIDEGAVGEIYLATEINPLNNKPHVLLEADISKLNSDYFIGFIITPLSAGALHVWADSNHSELTGNNLRGWTTGDSKYSISEIGGSGERIITTGAYVSKNTYTTITSQTPARTGEILGKLASFSAKGPTADGRVKPDITAPGSFIASSVSNYYASLHSLPLAKKTLWNKKEYYYGYQQGTSMSTPFVTGVLATWLEADPELTPEDVRAVLKETAIQDKMTGKIDGKGSNIWGYGKIDAWKGIKKCIEMASSIGRLSKFIPEVNIIPGGEKDYRILFAKENKNIIIAVYDTKGSIVYQQRKKQSMPAEEVYIDLANTPKGIYMIKVKSDQTFLVRKIVLK